jgi:hypothetical protein
MLHAAFLGLGSSGGHGCTPWLIAASLKFRGIASAYLITVSRYGLLITTTIDWEEMQ